MMSTTIKSLSYEDIKFSMIRDSKDAESLKKTYMTIVMLLNVVCGQKEVIGRLVFTFFAKKRRN